MKRKKEQKIFGMILFLVSFMIVLNIKNVEIHYDFIQLDTVDAYHREIDQIQMNIDELEQAISEMHTQIEDYRTALKEGTLEEVLQNEIWTQQVFSQEVSLKGPGVKVLLGDSERDLFPGEDPNNLVIHEIDVLNVINDLRRAGAEALAINGQRVTNRTKIFCAGPTITINDTTFGQPFIIEAIGDPDTLNASMNAPNSYAYILREYYDLFIQSEIQEEIIIAGFEQPINHTYISIQDGD